MSNKKSKKELIEHLEEYRIDQMGFNDYDEPRLDAMKDIINEAKVFSNETVKQES